MLQGTHTMRKKPRNLGQYSIIDSSCASLRGGKFHIAEFSSQGQNPGMITRCFSDREIILHHLALKNHESWRIFFMTFTSATFTYFAKYDKWCVLYCNFQAQRLHTTRRDLLQEMVWDNEFETGGPVLPISSWFAGVFLGKLLFRFAQIAPLLFTSKGPGAERKLQSQEFSNDTIYFPL